MQVNFTDLLISLIVSQKINVATFQKGKDELFMKKLLCKSNIQHPTLTESAQIERGDLCVLYLDETLADVARAEGFVAAGGHRQPWQEEEESGGGGEDQLTRPHPDGSPARHWKTPTSTRDAEPQTPGQRQANKTSSLTFHKRKRGAAVGA